MSPNLDALAVRFHDGDVDGAMVDLSLGLRDFRRSVTLGEWKEYIELARSHPIRLLVHQDPFTRHSFMKPRGYPGDAELIDLIYRQHTDEPMTNLGQAIFRFVAANPAPAAVRSRRRVLADRLAALPRDSEVFSVASGHLRELEGLLETGGSFARFVALDQDQRSLAVVNENFGQLGVTTLCDSVISVGRHSPTLGSFDFVYSAGLFDYFDQRLAKRVARSLFALVKPGGSLLIANFTDDIQDVGYMECYMDWWLQYRTVGDMQRLAEAVGAIGEVTVDSTGQVLFVEISRSGYNELSP